MANGRKLLVLAVVLAVIGLIWWRFSAVLRFETFLVHKAALSDFVAAHRLTASLGYIFLYAGVVAFSLPIALPLTLIGGILFGFWLGVAATAVGATIGAALLFLAARGLLHDYFVRTTERWLGAIRKEFEADAAAYLLMLRLTPVFPFAAVNLAAALLGTRFSTYLWTTFVGILPGTAAFTLTAAGLGAVIDQEAERVVACMASGTEPCRAGLDFGAVLSRELALGLAALGLVMVLSVIGRRWLARRSAPGPVPPDERTG